MSEQYLSLELEAAFPNLRRGEYERTSAEDILYNCIAHAAEITDAWWWPVEGPGLYWPPNVSKQVTIESFVQAYSCIGYEICNDGNRQLESGVQKIALYVDEDGVPTHAARQLTNGQWTSKLGRSEDISHNTLEALEGDSKNLLGYGKASIILKRHSTDKQSSAT